MDVALNVPSPSPWPERAHPTVELRLKGNNRSWEGHRLDVGYGYIFSKQLDGMALLYGRLSTRKER